MDRKELIKLQAMPLEDKIALAQDRIMQWHNHYNGQVYIAFSGGKDSTVLLHLVRQIYPEIPAVFYDTGLEFPEIRAFVKTISNVVWLKPTMTFKQVIESKGWPIISKNVAMAISRYRNTKDPIQRQLRLHGGINPTSGKVQTTGVIPKKYHYLIHAPFKIGEGCCDVMKKALRKRYEKSTNRKSLVGTMAADSSGRRTRYLSLGCNAFDAKQPRSAPLSVFLNQDIWQYITKFGVQFCDIYTKGYDNTGCVFCLFGIVQDPDRADRLKKTHPKLHSYCMEKLGMAEVIEWIKRGM